MSPTETKIIAFLMFLIPTVYQITLALTLRPPKDDHED